VQSAEIDAVEQKAPEEASATVAEATPKKPKHPKGSKNKKTSKKKAAKKKTSKKKTSKKNQSRRFRRSIQSSAIAITRHSKTTIQKAPTLSAPGMPPTLIPSNPVRNPSGNITVATTVSTYMVFSIFWEELCIVSSWTTIDRSRSTSSSSVILVS
jgi:hypothetical protein